MGGLRWDTACVLDRSLECLTAICGQGRGRREAVEGPTRQTYMGPALPGEQKARARVKPIVSKTILLMK